MSPNYVLCLGFTFLRGRYCFCDLSLRIPAKKGQTLLPADKDSLSWSDTLTLCPLIHSLGFSHLKYHPALASPSLRTASVRSMHAV